MASTKALNNDFGVTCASLGGEGPAIVWPIIFIITINHLLAVIK